MEDILFLIFTYITEALIVYHYAKSIYKHKINRYAALFIVFAAYIILMAVYKFLINSDIVNAVLITTANIAILYFIFESSFKSALFHGIVLCILLYISEFISLCIIALSLGVSWKSIEDNQFEIGVLLSRIIYFVCSSLLSKLSAKESRSKGWGRWVMLSILPVTSIFIIAAFRIIIDNFSVSRYLNIICIISVSLLLFTNIAVYWIYEQAEKSSQKLTELELINQKNNIDLQYLELLEKKNETMNIMVHDYKNNIAAIANMTDSAEIKDYINNMMGEITKFSRIARTKNRMLDVVLSKYNDICAAKKIKFDTDIITDNLSFMSSYDISSLFNNILDNAVEASEKSSEKYIRLEIAYSLNSYHRITAENSCDIKPSSERGNLITSKINPNAHGFGTKSIKRTIKKYSGESKWEYDDKNKRFKLIILFPVNEQCT